MKKHISFFVSLVFIFALIFSLAFKAPKGEVCIKVKNDTGASVTLHTGKGTAPINSGVQREFCLEEGSKLYFAEKGQKGKMIIEFTAKMNGKTIKLSDYK